MDAWVWRDALGGNGAADVCDLDQLRSGRKLTSQVRLMLGRGCSEQLQYSTLHSILDEVKPRAAMSAEGLGSLPR